MYELWLAIVSHPRTSSRQDKNLLWLIRKTGQLWIDCTKPVHGNINSNEAGSMWWTHCLSETRKKTDFLGSLGLNWKHWNTLPISETFAEVISHFYKTFMGKIKIKLCITGKNEWSEGDGTHHGTFWISKSSCKWYPSPQAPINMSG